LGGIFVEIFKDVVFRIAPITRRDAKIMITSIKGYPILAGARGKAAVDFDFLEELLLRTSQLIVRHPEIKEMDLNPVILNPDRKDCAAVDARIRIKSK
jgi:acyl-CoA synthetase (NDP forming)